MTFPARSTRILPTLGSRIKMLLTMRRLRLSQVEQDFYAEALGLASREALLKDQPYRGIYLTQEHHAERLTREDLMNTTLEKTYDNTLFKAPKVLLKYLLKDANEGKVIDIFLGHPYRMPLKTKDLAKIIRGATVSDDSTFSFIRG